MDPYSGQGSWMTVAGTSLGAQAWGALIAIVDQGRALDNQATLGSDQTLTALYSLPSSDFHTVGGGFNQQTGLGTPNGASFIDDLVAFNPSTGQSDSVAATPAPATPPVTGHKKGHHKKAVHHKLELKASASHHTEKPPPSTRPDHPSRKGWAGVELSVPSSSGYSLGKCLRKN